MATSSSSSSGVNKKRAVPYSAVPTAIPTSDSMPTDLSVVDSTVPCSAVDSRFFASAGASLHCSMPEVSSDEDECPLSAIDVEEIIEDGMKSSKFRKSNDGNRLKPKKHKIKHITPNAFVALPVKSASVCSQIEDLHRHLISKEPKIHNVLMPINRMHITLMVIKLDNDDDIMRYVTKLIFLLVYCIL